MEKLISYIEILLKWSKDTPDYANTFFNQAFGAVQFYIIERNLSNAEFAELETKWYETYKPSFEVIMYGGGENDEA